MKTNSCVPAACSIAAKACILFAAVSALWLSPAEGQCPQGWDVSYGWRIKQGPTNVDLDLRQKGTVITGTARYEGTIKEPEGGLFGKFGATGTIRGTVDGTIVGDQIKMHIYWDIKNTTGVYNGTIRASGKIEGTVYGKEAPSKKVDWYSDTRMPCAKPTPAPTPAPVPKPTKTIKATGKAKIPPKPAIPDSADASGAAPAQGAPVITANPRTVSIPAGQSEGTTTLTWDGGSEHPYAEVWVKVGDEDEKFLVEKGKGTRQAKVAAGKTYLYILTDSGKRLATVTVTGK